MMFYMILYGGFLAVTLGQLLICRKCRRKGLGLLPAVLLLLAMGICTMGFQVASGAGDQYRELAFQLDWYSVIFGFWLAGDALAWLLHAVIKLAQKIRNEFVM